MPERHPAPTPDGPDHRPLPAEYSSTPGGSGYAAAPYDAFEEEESSFSIGTYLQAFYRHKWWILAAALLGVGGAYFAWQQGEPEYVAQGSLWVRTGGTQDTGPIQTEGILPAQSWMDLLRSFTVLDPVVRDQKLYLNPARPGDFELLRNLEIQDNLASGRYVLRMSETGGEATLLRQGEEVDRAAPGDSIGEAQGILWAVPTGLEPEREVAFSLSTHRAAAVRLRDQVLSQMDPRGNFILLQLTGRDPERITAVINGLMDNHVELAAELKRGTLDQEYETVLEQLRTAEANLAEAEGALEGFRVQTITLPSEEPRGIQPGIEMTRDPVYEEFFQMSIQEEQLARDLDRLRELASLMAADGGVPLEQIQGIPSVADATQLRAALDELLSARAEEEVLLRTYTPQHPLVLDVGERIRRLETERIPSLLSQTIQRLETERSVISGRIVQSEADLTQIPPRAIEEARLRRRVDIAEQLYTELQGRFQFANLARATSQPDVEVLDRAVVPDAPANDPRPTLALAVFGVFLGLGLGGALLAHQLDPSLRTPDEVQSAFGLTVLGAIPKIVSGGGKRGASAMKNTAQVREAFRELRTNLTYAYGSAGPIVVTISSPGMEEGKTTLTTNLGVAFSELGLRTLIIDADTRRGDLHRFLGGHRKPGLTDYLSSVASGDEVLQESSHQNLDFIGSGTHVSHSPELLSSREMGRMMSALKQRYEVILVDSPPLGAGADPLVLSSITGHMVLVVRSGSTDRAFTQAKLEPLGRLPIRMLGVVLNDYEPSRLGAGRYQYYASYLPGYEAHEEEGVEPNEPSAGRDGGGRRLTAGAGAGRFGDAAEG